MQEQLECRPGHRQCERLRVWTETPLQLNGTDTCDASRETTVYRIPATAGPGLFEAITRPTGNGTPSSYDGLPGVSSSGSPSLPITNRDDTGSNRGHLTLGSAEPAARPATLPTHTPGVDASPLFKSQNGRLLAFNRPANQRVFTRIPRPPQTCTHVTAGAIRRGPPLTGRTAHADGLLSGHRAGQWVCTDH